MRKLLFQIETDRLIIRDIQKSDFTNLLKRKIEPTARPNILLQKSNFVYDKNELEDAIESANSFLRQDYKLAVILKSDNSLIGTCSIYNVSIDSIASIGWHYEHKYSGNGYATEAAQELLYLGFEMSRVAMIYAESFAINFASIRIMEKLGMSPDWSVGKYKRLDGNGVEKPSVLYKILRKEWLIQND
ncbi:MAG: GNAT family protein [Acidobacteriota bacterium]